ncbi:MAG: aminoacyl-histidine dipeptidase [Bacteroidetes bacterium]|nr:aminoacyl-histidine dipeptidase [Bacteroidota bacterium]
MSKKAIEGLKPELIWEQFYNLSQVPRPSKKEEKIRGHVKNFAKEHGLKFKEDAVGNIVIKVPAKQGFEKSPTIVLQGHLDMVCEMNKGTKHDFDNDPIKLIKQGEWIKADGTTLGADNGIGVAAGMAIALDKDAEHGPLELLCTVDEETGLTGANALKTGFIKGKTLLNLDSEEDGTFYVGCAGGVDTVGIFKIKKEKIKKDHLPFEITISGLKGGHSGLDILNGRANAIKVLALILERLSKLNLRIGSISGGSKRNAIPREAEAVILLNEADKNTAKKIIDTCWHELKNEYKVNDPELKVSFKKLNSFSGEAFTEKFTAKIVHTLLALPHGVVSMSSEIPDLVDTSTNLATILEEKGLLKIGTSQRSSIESAKNNIAAFVKSVFKLARAKEIIIGDGYPGWQPNLESVALSKSKKVYFEMYGRDPKVKAIHAGLECGILGNKFKGLDMLSFGPTIHGAHSPDEKVHIPTVDKFYSLLKGVLKALR